MSGITSGFKSLLFRKESCKIRILNIILIYEIPKIYGKLSWGNQNETKRKTPQSFACGLSGGRDDAGHGFCGARDFGKSTDGGEPGGKGAEVGSAGGSDGSWRRDPGLSRRRV